MVWWKHSSFASTKSGTTGGATDGCMAVEPIRHGRYQRPWLPRAELLSPFLLFIYFLLDLFFLSLTLIDANRIAQL
jgi:hypothetical protein